MTNYVMLADLPEQVRYGLADVRGTAREDFASLWEWYRQGENNNAWHRSEDKLSVLPDEWKPFFERLMADYIRESTATRESYYAEYRVWWDQDLSTAEERLASYTVRNQYYDGEREALPTTWRTSWMPGPDKFYTLDGILAQVKSNNRLQGDTSHLQLEWDPATLLTMIPKLMVKYDPLAFPAFLRRHLTAAELEGYAIEPARTYASPVYTLDESENLVTASTAYYIRGVANAPMGRDAMVNLLNARRREYRDNLLRSLPGYQAELERERQTRQEQDQKRVDSTKRFREFRNKLERHNEEYIKTLPFVKNGTLASRRWGIEIETGAGRDLRWGSEGAPDGWEAKGDGSLESAYGNRWVEPEDCSYYGEDHTTTEIEVEHNNGSWIMVANPDFRDPRYCDYCGETGDYDDDDCVELVSPILSSAHSHGLKEICEDLEHAPSTETAGIHVHVEAKDLTVAQVKQLVLGYDRIEHMLEASYYRVERGYCKRRSVGDISDIVRDNEARDIAHMNHGDRYVTVNLQAIQAHGTIEFRAMGPKYNYDLLVRWAMFCREMVNLAKAGVTAKQWNKVNSWADVEKLFAQYGSEYKLAAGVAANEVSADLVEV